jgi:O-acetylhomoserine (thiol)-lyase
MKPDTLAIHGGFDNDSGTGATAVPIFQTTAFEYKTAKELSDVFAGRAPGYIYTRIANPTTYALEQRLTKLEAGIACIATASGMGAITAAVMGLLKAGDSIVAAAGIFGGTVSLFENTLGRFGITTKWVIASDTSQIEDAIDESTKLVFVETIGNPRLDIPDFEAIANLTTAANIPLVVDSTVTTPSLIQPGKFGADIVIHSTSKYINGHGTAMGGAIVDTGNYNWKDGKFDDIAELAKRAGQFAFIAKLRNLVYRDIGVCPAPMNSFLMLQGLETLGARMTTHSSNALKLAELLKQDGRVKEVRYPGLADHENNDRVNKYFGSKAAGLLTMTLEDRDKAFAFIDNLKLAKTVANLGDARTLVIHPASTIFYEFSEDEKARAGVTDGMIRVSVGIEDIEDIIEDFKQALAYCK